MDESRLVWDWYSENIDYIFRKVDKIAAGVHKEYEKAKVTRFKKVKIRAYYNKLEFCSQEDVDHGQWDIIEDEQLYHFGYLDEAGMSAMAEVFYELERQFQAAGYMTRLFLFGVAGRHELELTW